MNANLAKHSGKTVTITLRSNQPVGIKGVLRDQDTAFVVLEMSEQGKKAEVFIPVTSILHIAVESPED